MTNEQDIQEKQETQDSNIHKALKQLERNLTLQEHLTPVPFETFLESLVEKPFTVLRNVFQMFHDMVMTYVKKGEDEYPEDPESIQYVKYDCNALFAENSDHPFFADRLFANRLINHVSALKRGTQQNKIYIFDGPPGCGKSTFLNNLLRKFEEFSNTESGMNYEIVWRLDRKLIGNAPNAANSRPMLEQMIDMLHEEEDAVVDPIPNRGKNNQGGKCGTEDDFLYSFEINDDIVEIPCPGHDHPILMLDKRYRRTFLDELFENDARKWKIFTEKEFDWVFKAQPCTICSSLFEALLRRFQNPLQVFSMLYVRPFRFNRRLGEGISVFNPGDNPMRQSILTNPIIQRQINFLLKSSNQVRYMFSRYAKTNNGVYALMDIKSHNIERLIELHNIVSEGVHKVEDIEENVDSLFFALMNPEDKKNISDIQSFSDRIQYINIPYVMDINTEVDIYRNIFGKHIDEAFLPRVLHNFARIIIASRLNTRSEALLEWIPNPDKYRMYCDENLQLLKMEIYTGHIPPWLSEEDRKRFTAVRRKRIIAESELEGEMGFSGRDSIKIFNDFYSTFVREDALINMSALYMFFTMTRADLGKLIPTGFLDSLVRMYDYTILQEVKESLYYYNEEQISRDIQNYIFAVNFEPGSLETCTFTGDKLEITDSFFENMEKRILGHMAGDDTRFYFRRETQREYTSKTLTQEIMLEGISITETKLFESIHGRYVHNLKEKVLDPFISNENFRQAVKDFGEKDFEAHDKKIRDDVTFLIGNLCDKSRYTRQGAKEVCMYVIDNNLTGRFSDI